MSTKADAKSAKHIWKTAYNAEPEKGEVNSSPSLTIQGQTISIAQMLTRINNGMPIEMRNFEYLSDISEPMPKFRDLTDLEDISNEIQYVHKRTKTDMENDLKRRENVNSAELKRD